MTALSKHWGALLQGTTSWSGYALQPIAQELNDPPLFILDMVPSIKIPLSAIRSLEIAELATKFSPNYPYSLLEGYTVRMFDTMVGPESILTADILLNDEMHVQDPKRRHPVVATFSKVVASYENSEVWGAHPVQPVVVRTKHQDILSALRAELRIAGGFSLGKLIVTNTNDVLKKMAAILKEAFRLYPPSASTRAEKPGAAIYVNNNEKSISLETSL
ncbi:hypothetical protein BDZ91DRAFT_762759 [Kalaharituber pfeilii]|nr:hypothetical protein BDZ91DRAFT_762759 [Kalaharituber pfeilii]